ncbi:MAG TPA: YcxB family protein [Verrucomicrobiae bacterium]|nr:YcxB family protein [Verrucomicrobiae bacterium]
MDAQSQKCEITIRYHYSLEDALLAHTLYLRGNPPRGFWVLMSLISLFVLVCGALMCLEHEPGGTSGLAAAVSMVLFFWIIHPFLQRHRERRHWRERTNHDERVVVLSDHGIKQIKPGTPAGVKWEQIAKVVQSPSGLLIRVGQIYQLLPRRAFDSQEDFERATELSRARCRRFRSLPK